jgi:hypothetical protein
VKLVTLYNNTLPLLISVTYYLNFLVKVYKEFYYITYYLQEAVLTKKLTLSELVKKSSTLYETRQTPLQSTAQSRIVLVTCLTGAKIYTFGSSYSVEYFTSFSFMN